MPLTPNLARIIAAMIDAKLDGESGARDGWESRNGGPAVGLRSHPARYPAARSAAPSVRQDPSAKSA
ncbi:hypothetical protein SMC4_04375 [Candidatus Cryosericum hinesii]|jgi:hypothetical protein|nr:hypothetical protein SMC4_04375 [Candidatus Cryosericum hinesii]